MKQRVLLSGMPRSGSTMLAALLAQNASFKVNEASTLLPLLNNTRKFWSSAQRHDVVPRGNKLLPVLKAIWDAYHPEDAVVVDKHREWPLYLDLVDKLTEQPIKLICTVRDPIECAASFDRLHRQEPETYTQIEASTENTGANTFGRAKEMLAPDGAIGKAYSALYEAAIVQGRLAQMLFVDYHKLCDDPAGQLERIYHFLGVDPFTHQFEHLENAEYQNDGAYFGHHNLHVIEPKVREGKHDLGRLNFVRNEFQLAEFWQSWT